VRDDSEKIPPLDAATLGEISSLQEAHVRLSVRETADGVTRERRREVLSESRMREILQSGSMTDEEKTELEAELAEAEKAVQEATQELEQRCSRFYPTTVKDVTSDIREPDMAYFIIQLSEDNYCEKGKAPAWVLPLFKYLKEHHNAEALSIIPGFRAAWSTEDRAELEALEKSVADRRAELAELTRKNWCTRCRRWIHTDGHAPWCPVITKGEPSLD
jgi:hypothetical protein